MARQIFLLETKVLTTQNNLINALNSVAAIFAAESNITTAEYHAQQEFLLNLAQADFLSAAQHGLLAGNTGIIAPKADFSASKVFVARTPISIQVNENVPTFRRSAKSLKGAMQRATSDVATHLPFTVDGACILKVDSLMAMNFIEDDEVGYFPEPFMYQRPFNGDARHTSATIKFGAYSTGKMTADALAEANYWRNLLAAEIHKVLVRMGLGATTAPMMLQMTGFCSDYRTDSYSNPDGSSVTNYGFGVELGGIVFTLERILNGKPDQVHADVATKKKPKNHYREILRAKAARKAGNPLPSATATFAPTAAPVPTPVVPSTPPAAVVTPPAPNNSAQVAQSRPNPEPVSVFPQDWSLHQKAYYAAIMFRNAFGDKDNRSVQGSQFLVNIQTNTENPFTSMAKAQLVMPTLDAFKAQVKAAEAKCPTEAADLRQAIANKNANKSTPAVEAPAPQVAPTPAPTPVVATPAAVPVAAGGGDLRSKLLANRKDSSAGFVTDDQVPATPAQPNITTTDDDVVTSYRGGFPGQ